MNIILPDNHFSIAATSDILQICEPLKLLNIRHFHYIKNFTDGSQINFCTNAAWLKLFFEKSLYKIGKYERHPDQYKQGFAFWSFIVPQEITEYAREFCLVHGVTIILKNHDSCEFFCFSNSNNPEKSIEHSLSNLELLQKFILYFKDKAASIIAAAERNYCHRIIISDHYAKTSAAELLPIIPFNYRNLECAAGPRKAFLRFLATSRFNANLCVNNLGTISLTNKETDCIIQLLRGKTAEEIGECLFLSRRTVESHLENVKNKLGCNTKKEIKVILKDLLDYLIY